MKLRRRTLLMGLLFLAGGAIVNVAVAWGGTVLQPSHQRDRLLDANASRELWDSFAPPTWSYSGLRGVELPNLFSSWSAAFGSDDSGDPFIEATVWSVSQGIPLRSLQGTGYSTGPVQHQIGVFDFCCGRQLATLPIWPGFAINTIFYAAILWLLWIAPGRIRRFVRVRRGRCPACAYPIGTSPVCTECGNPVTNKAVPSS